MTNKQLNYLTKRMEKWDSKGSIELWSIMYKISKKDEFKFHEKIKKIEKYMDNEIEVDNYLDIFIKYVERPRTKKIDFNYFNIFGCSEREYERYCKSKTKNLRPIRRDVNSLDFCIERFGEEEGLKEYDRRIYNCGLPVRVEYWTKQGFSLKESKEKLSERQSTFSLYKCTKKYGLEEGTKVWKKRQEKWQNTLNSKSKEEIEQINMKKASSKGFLPEGNGRLYYIKFFNTEIEFWKIGITTKLVEGGRFESKKLFEKKYKLKYEVIFEKHFDDIINAFHEEQLILKENNQYRFKYNENGFSSTECFKIDIMN